MKISIDTRTLQPGDIFIPVKGPNFDGHDFIKEAKKKGASKILDVDLGEFAKKHRQKFKIPVVAVTGSVGKTTTKDMIAAVLGQKFNVLKNEENLNNEIGLPLSILKLEKKHTACVLEMAMRHRGDIKYLTEIARPTIGVITNVGLSHIELLKNRPEIAKAKAELLEALAKKSVIILNRDDDFYKSFEKKARRRALKIKTFSLKKEADFQAKDIQTGPENVSFILKTGSGKIKINLQLPGEHNVYNALAAAAASAVLGLSLEAIKKGLENFAPSKKRMEIIETEKFKIINDTYNASPDSVKAALKVLAAQKNFMGKLNPRRIAVLGDMLELGRFSQAAHRQIGEFLAELGINILIAVGENSFYINQGALNAGMPVKNMEHFKTNKDAADYLKRILRKGDVVLVKGSRAMKMEEIVEFLKK